MTACSSEKSSYAWSGLTLRAAMSWAGDHGFALCCCHQAETSIEWLLCGLGLSMKVLVTMNKNPEKGFMYYSVV